MTLELLFQKQLEKGNNQFGKKILTNILKFVSRIHKELLKLNCKKATI